jgi:hypothetical protein
VFVSDKLKFEKAISKQSIRLYLFQIKLILISNTKYVQYLNYLFILNSNWGHLNDANLNKQCQQLLSSELNEVLSLQKNEWLQLNLTNATKTFMKWKTLEHLMMLCP